MEYGVLAPEYYERLLRDLDAPRPWVVYTDDAKAFSRLYGNLLRQGVVIAEAISARETLVELSNSEFLVIGNSTLSGWAGWLGQARRETIRVIRPQPFYRSGDIEVWSGFERAPARYLKTSRLLIGRPWVVSRRTAWSKYWI